MKEKKQKIIGLLFIALIISCNSIDGSTMKSISQAKENDLVCDEDVNFPYISGYADGTFRPERPVTREELATMLARLITKNHIPDEDNQYSDLPQDRFSADAVNYITQLGIMKPLATQIFRPMEAVSIKEFNNIVKRLTPYIKNNNVILPNGEGTLTRVQVVMVLNNLFNVQCNTCHTCPPFSDIKPESPAYQAILCATRTQEEEEL